MKTCYLDKADHKRKLRHTLPMSPDPDDSKKLTFKVNKDIIFHGVGFFGRTSRNLTIPISENFTIELENGDNIMIFDTTVCIEQDGTSKMYEIHFNKPFLLKAGEMYSVRVYREQMCAEHFIAYGLETKYNCEGVQFKVNECGGSFIKAFLFEKAGNSCECVLS